VSMTVTLGDPSTESVRRGVSPAPGQQRQQGVEEGAGGGDRPLVGSVAEQRDQAVLTSHRGEAVGVVAAAFVQPANRVAERLGQRRPIVGVRDGVEQAFDEIGRCGLRIQQLARDGAAFGVLRHPDDRLEMPAGAPVLGLAVAQMLFGEIDDRVPEAVTEENTLLVDLVLGRGKGGGTC